VERSANGTDFAPIGDKVLAAGNSNTNKYYELIDEKPLVKAYYRLRMVDVDGAFSYSTSVLLQRKRGAGVVSIAPNPATQNAVVTYEMETAGTVTFNVIDALGRIAQTQTTQAAAGTNQETLYIAQLPSAVYSLQVLQNNTVSQVVKLTVVK
jgi:hypothetical protein